jgi:hypothetical protein
MSTDILELDNCFLIVNSPEQGEGECQLVSGVRVPLRNEFWYESVTFLSGLPDGTWGSVRDFVIANRDELSRMSGVSNTTLTHLADTTGTALTRQVISVVTNGESTSAGSFLFSPSANTTTKRHVRHGGVYSRPSLPISGRSGQVRVDTYTDSRCSSLDAANNTEAPARTTPTQVMNYTYKPEYKFMTMPKEQTECYFGLELEVNTKIPWVDIHRAMTTVLPIQEDFIFAKSDGSIDGKFSNSYEIVSHPMSPRRMRSEFTTLFKKIERIVADKGLEWGDVFDVDTTTTGIHIHVSKGSFTPLSRTHKKKFMMLWNTSSPAISKFTSKLACRDLKSNRYAKPSSSYSGRSLAWMLTEGKNSDRHCACNETSNTVEVRAFRGQPTVASIRHAIDTTEAMLRFTEQAANSQLSRHFPYHFMTWLGKQNRNSYRNLKRTLASEPETPKPSSTYVPVRPMF